MFPTKISNTSDKCINTLMAGNAKLKYHINLDLLLYFLNLMVYHYDVFGIPPIRSSNLKT